jgi:hypothetical protein
MKSPYEKRYKYGFADYLKGKNKNKYRFYYIILILSMILMSTILGV